MKYLKALKHEIDITTSHLLYSGVIGTNSITLVVCTVIINYGSGILNRSKTTKTIH